MASVLQQMEKDLHSDSFGEDADWAFHFAIAEASRNKIVISLMEELSAKIKSALKASRLQMYVTPGMPERLLAEHRAIFEAIEAQRVKDAENRMVEHLSGVQEQLLAANPFEAKGERKR